MNMLDIAKMASNKDKQSDLTVKPISSVFNSTINAQNSDDETASMSDVEEEEEEEVAKHPSKSKSGQKNDTKDTSPQTKVKRPASERQKKHLAGCREKLKEKRGKMVTTDDLDALLGKYHENIKQHLEKLYSSSNNDSKAKKQRQEKEESNQDKHAMEIDEEENSKRNNTKRDVKSSSSFQSTNSQSKSQQSTQSATRPQVQQTHTPPHTVVHSTNSPSAKQIADLLQQYKTGRLRQFV